MFNDGETEFFNEDHTPFQVTICERWRKLNEAVEWRVLE